MLGAGVGLAAVGVIVVVALHHPPPAPEVRFENDLLVHGVRLGAVSAYLGKTVCADLGRGTPPDVEVVKLQRGHFIAGSLNTRTSSYAFPPPDAGAQVVHFATVDLCPQRA